MTGIFYDGFGLNADNKPAHSGKEWELAIGISVAVELLLQLSETGYCG